MSVTSTEPELETIRPTIVSALRAGGLTGLFALVANLLVLGLGVTAGAGMSVVRTGTTEPVEVGVAVVAIMTIVPLLLGTAALAGSTRWGARGWVAVAWTGLAIGILTLVMPFGVEASTGTQLTLAAMHLITGLTWFTVLRRYRPLS